MTSIMLQLHPAMLGTSKQHEEEGSHGHSIEKLLQERKVPINVFMT
jgi:hypothetical protein